MEDEMVLLFIMAIMVQCAADTHILSLPATYLDIWAQSIPDVQDPSACPQSPMIGMIPGAWDSRVLLQALLSSQGSTGEERAWFLISRGWRGREISRKLLEAKKD